MSIFQLLYHSTSFSPAKHTHTHAQYSDHGIIYTDGANLASVHYILDARDSERGLCDVSGHHTQSHTLTHWLPHLQPPSLAVRERERWVDQPLTVSQRRGGSRVGGPSLAAADHGLTLLPPPSPHLLHLPPPPPPPPLQWVAGEGT